MSEVPHSRFSTRALEDFKLVDLAISGNEQAYTKLLTLYRRPVYHMILRMVRTTDDAEDLTIESFTKAFRNLHSFKKDFTFSTWLFRVASNNTIDFLRKKQLSTLSIHESSTRRNGEATPFDVEDNALTPQERAIKTQKEETIRSLIKTLPPKYRKLLQMRYYQELSYNEVAEELGVPISTVKARLHRAKELMYDMVKYKKEYI